MSGKYVYHYSAMQHLGDTEFNFMDGIMTSDRPIMSETGYIETKRNLLEYSGHPDVELTLTSFTFLHRESSE